MKKTLFLSLALLGAITGTAILNSERVFAASGTCYYDPSKTCSVSGAGTCGTNDVLPGRATNCNGAALGGVNTRSEFINKIINWSDSNGGRDQRGARFIMRETTGTINKADFRRILEQSDVTFKFENDTGSVTSWYDPGKNDFFYDTYPGGTWSSRPVIKIYYQGALYDVIEIWCGNMTGKHKQIPPPPDTVIAPHADLPAAGPYYGGQTINVHAWVGKSGPDTRSDWSFILWYDENGDNSYNDGAANLIQSASGSGKYYGTASTDIANQSRTMNGTKHRICVWLRLSSPTDNVRGGITTISGNPDISCRTIVEPNELTPTATLSASTVEPGQPISANASVTSSPGTLTSTSNYRRIFWSEKGGNASRYDDPADQLLGASFNESGTKTYSGITTNFGGWGPVAAPADATRICTSLQLTNPSANASVPAPGISVACAIVATSYFFEVTNGDVNAAACLASCASTPGISAINGGSGASYRGSGSQVGAFSVAAIDGFTSANSPTLFTAPSAKRQTFANSGNASASSEYGGGFAQRYQLPDYWTGPTLGSTTVTSASPTIVRQPGSISVKGSSSVGSVGVGNVPGLQWVISGGDIYIDQSVVGDLYGVYIAKGNIYTCANGFSPVALGVPMASNCNNQLRIHGALIAGGSVKMQRTSGSLVSGAPAEIIDYNPFVWMQAINPNTTLPTTTSGKLDFITSLPPIL